MFAAREWRGGQGVSQHQALCLPLNFAPTTLEPKRVIAACLSESVPGFLPSSFTVVRGPESAADSACSPKLGKDNSPGRFPGLTCSSPGRKRQLNNPLADAVPASLLLRPEGAATNQPRATPWDSSRGHVPPGSSPSASSRNRCSICSGVVPISVSATW